MFLDLSSRDMKNKQDQYLKKMTDLEQEIELLRQQAKLEKYRKDLQEVTSHPVAAQVPALMVSSDVTSCGSSGPCTHGE